VGIGEGWGIIPDVAESWEISEDGRMYVFHLRDDVYWSDGTQVTARDFVYSWKRSLNPATEAPIGKAHLLYDIKNARSYHQGEMTEPEKVGVREIDQLTLEIELERAASYFLQTLVVLQPIPSHIVEAYGDDWTDPENMISNGPFLLDSYDPGKSINFVRNPTYHGVFSGNLNKVEISFGRHETEEELKLYISDQLDIAHLGIPTFQARHKYAGEYVSQYLPGIYALFFNPTRPPFDDRRVRQAFVMAADREILASQIVKGMRSPALGGFIPPALPGHSPKIGLPFDPDRAQHLLKQAGYSDGQDLSPLEIVFAHLAAEQIEYLSAQWLEHLNVNITGEGMDYEEIFTSRYNTNLFYNGWYHDYLDPDNFLRVCIKTELPQWQDQRYDDLLQKAQQTTNQTDRIRLYQEADRLLIEEAIVMPLTYFTAHVLVKPWVKLPSWGVGYWHLKDVIIEPH
jgi:oligopeptide transport system substrate-binding protein